MTSHGCLVYLSTYDRLRKRHCDWSGSMTTSVLKGFFLSGSLLVLTLGGALAERTSTHELTLGPEAVATVPAATSARQEHPGQRTYLQYCSPCHGQKGRGDGPAAVAFHPPPADYTNPDGIPKMTDEQVMEVITKGRGAMPAWGAILTREQLVPLVAYLRELSRGEG
jgi:mono/diheme cytochrome c family protein